MVGKALRLTTTGVLVLMLVGCGLSDYENLMRATQERIKRFAEESELLGDPIVVPLKRVQVKETVPDPKTATKDSGKGSKTSKDPKAAKDPKTAPAKETPKEVREPVIRYPFFLRLPRALKNAADPEPRFDLLFRFGKGGTPTPPALAKPGVDTARVAMDIPIIGPPTGLLEVYLAFSNEPASAFVDKIARLLPRTTDSMTGSSPEITVPDRRERLSYELREFSDAQSAWSVYCHSENGQTVAIVFRIAKAQKDSLSRSIELSLASLAMGNEAAAVMQSYNRRPK